MYRVLKFANFSHAELVPLLGWEIILSAFAENFSISILSDFSISTGYRPAIAFMILIIVLILRPSGIMGKKEGKSKQFKRRGEADACNGARFDDAPETAAA